MWASTMAEAAGQTTEHCHVDLIPLRQGDVENPKDSIRHVIPGKAAVLRYCSTWSESHNLYLFNDASRILV